MPMFAVTGLVGLYIRHIHGQDVLLTHDVLGDVLHSRMRQHPFDMTQSRVTLEHIYSVRNASK